MRCPYCGGLNQERVTFCTSCGRDLTRPPRSQMPPSAQPANRVSTTQGRGPVPPRPGSQPVQTARRQSGGAVPARVPAAPEPPVPEPPAPFPPRTLEQFHQLLAPGAQPYTVVKSLVGDGRRKLVRITYPHCTGWQQAATLLKALKEQQDEKCNAITIQGMLPEQPDFYTFTNGQLQFERNVRLGGQIGNRYVVETENGFASDSKRFVLNE